MKVFAVMLSLLFTIYGCHSADKSKDSQTSSETMAQKDPIESLDGDIKFYIEIDNEDADEPESSEKDKDLFFSYHDAPGPCGGQYVYLNNKSDKHVTATVLIDKPKFINRCSPYKTFEKKVFVLAGRKVFLGYSIVNCGGIDTVRCSGVTYRLKEPT